MPESKQLLNTQKDGRSREYRKQPDRAPDWFNKTNYLVLGFHTPLVFYYCCENLTQRYRLTTTQISYSSVGQKSNKELIG